MNRTQLTARCRSCLAGIALGLAAAAPAQAALLDYEINFIATVGSDATGSFTYDDVIKEFSAFTVRWEGYEFDLTYGANSGELQHGITKGKCNVPWGAELSFLLVTKADCTGSSLWQASILGDWADFIMSRTASAIREQTAARPGSPPYSEGSDWTVTLVSTPTVPLPTPLSLLLVGVAALAITRRR